MNTATRPKGPPWISGPDPQHHKMYVAFGYQRVTARLRGDQWNLTWEQWRDIWLPHWHQRGKTAHDLCLCRRDIEGAWEVNNIELLTRKEHGRRVREYYK